jgi:endonuclease YncB( thermonuclease family)
LLAVSSVAGFAQERTIVGKVVEVLDGDTITVQDEQQKQHIIRLAGIDAPEVNQDHGKKARKYLSDLVLDKAVSVTTSKIDRTGEFVGKVLVYGRDVGLEMVMAGLAWHYKQYANEQNDRDRQIFEGAELHARKSRFNLWSSSRPTPPWEFRKEPSELPNVELRTLSAPVNPGSTATVPERAPTQQAVESKAPIGEILGNRNSKIYHWQGCPGYDKVAEKNRVMFKTRADAEAAGFRAAKNCN